MGAVKAALRTGWQGWVWGVWGEPGPRHIFLSQSERAGFCVSLALSKRKQDSDKGCCSLPLFLSPSQGLGVTHTAAGPVTEDSVCGGCRGKCRHLLRAL